MVANAISQPPDFCIQYPDCLTSNAGPDAVILAPPAFGFFTRYLLFSIHPLLLPPLSYITQCMYVCME